MPYLTAGFPDLASTASLIRRADALGVAAIEIGVPYSDSIADGPVIQDSFHYVLERGLHLPDVFHLAQEVRPTVACGLIAMVSYAVVHKVGDAAFFTKAASAGFDGVILPDVPVEEAESIAGAANDARLCYIGLVAPTTAPHRRVAIARNATGFVYQIATAGTTGERRHLSDRLSGDVTALRECTDLPICVGFGVSTSEQVRSVCEIADGAIVGSAIVRRIGEGLKRGDAGSRIVDDATEFLAELVAGTSHLAVDE